MAKIPFLGGKTSSNSKQEINLESDYGKSLEIGGQNAGSSRVPSLPMQGIPKPPAPKPPKNSEKPAENKTPAPKKEIREEIQKTPEGAAVQIEDPLGFFIDTKPKIFHIPNFDERSKINIRYPLLPPYAYAHVYWNEKENELFYAVEEPKLSDTEIELLKLIKLGMEEMINISFIKASKSKLIIKYLEENVQTILRELGAKVSRETYNKIMYYIYRDSVGMNYIEPLMRDRYIEDIECNGSNFPIYIVHRKFQNIKTNVIYETETELTEFVEKLAQKAGRYISYASPLLDGTLPDGSRVNATYTRDITTRGPTFTIRKFTERPLTPIHLIANGTISPEAVAFLWLAIEYKFNVMVIGETASGKTTFLNAIADFIPPEARICSIEDTRELNIPHINWLPAVTRSGFGMPNFAGKEVGEIDLFDLLKETFRQNPDYVILGETRGAEASVLFQGMASGHPSMSTFHAASVETLVKRLETPPIELPPSLIETLDIICVITHAKEQQNKRRMKELNEIITVEQGLGKVKYNTLFKWDPISDNIKLLTTNSLIIKKITERTGTPPEKIRNELGVRTALLNRLKEQGVSDYKEFGEAVQQYYKNRAATLSKFRMQNKK